MVDIYNTLDSIFDRMKRGEDLDAILDEYPDDRETLRRLVRTAQEVKKGDSTRPSSAFKERTRPRIMTEITSRKRAKLTPWKRFRLWWHNQRR
ncbi:MAG: hypothetical protein HYZ26_12285 [Chloroflexi bacterium]|nr:hypothetical protein [Chloroflexota bacterium]